MKSIKRRDFLKGALAGSAMVAAPFNILKAGPSPNSKLNIACIGVGLQGSGNTEYLARNNNVIALCDVDKSWHRKAIASKKSLHKIKLWKDYRVMFDKIGKDIDAVLVATPEHSHYAISVYAIRRGKHVYCQKPLCHTVNEVRLLAEEAKKHKNVVTQMGNQGHSGLSSAMLRDWGQAGAVGPIREVHAYSRKNYWIDKPLVKGSIVPETLDWNLYLNRAEEIPFSTSYMNREWIRYSHFSGAVGDMAAHILDPAYYALDLRVPLSVRAEVNTPAYPGSLPRSGVITWEFAARGKMPPVSMKYYLGLDIESPWPKHLEAGRREITSGSVMVGEHASIMAGSHSQGGRIIPESVMKETPKPPKVALRCKGRTHFDNWTLACKGEDTAMSNFEYAGPLSEIIVLGDIALLHPGRKLLWDSKNMKITNDEAANKSLFMRRLAPRDHLNWC
ncbi:MAG: Gfo/Idh/MocA family oxidoreductase [Planctomycetes bacterium]|nr:Gfo/Idh/MocA family oxidoreductase [Planctomycetota bacterium]